MRTRLVFLVFFTLVLTSVAAIAVVDDFPYTLSRGKNLIAVPAVPLNPHPGEVVDGRPPVFNGIPIDGLLLRWDAVAKSSKSYDELDPGAFGNVLIGDGYWLSSAAGASSSYQGLTDTDTMDIWISLPRAGLNLIGNPFSFDYLWANAKVTDGNETISLYDASQYGRGWILSIATWWDAPYQSSRDVGLPDDLCFTDYLHPWHGYWVRSNVDKIALILESPL